MARFGQALVADAAVVLTWLKRTPLLWGWLLLSAVLACGIWQWTGLVVLTLNLLLLGVYVLVIRYFTPRPPTPLPIRRPALELGVVLVWFGVTMLCTMSFHRLLNLGGFSRWQLQSIPDAASTVSRTLSLPFWMTGATINAAMNSFESLIPLVLILMLGYGRQGMGLTWGKGYARLTAALLLLTVLLGLPFHQQIYGSHSVPQVMVLYFIGLFINAVPEELLFRGLLFSRLEPFVGGLNALVLSAWLFNASHIPSYMAQDGASFWLALLTSLTFVFPSGLVWGYLYYRTRSVIPGILWHGATGVLGLTFIGL